MTVTEAAALLTEYNAWRRGAATPQDDPYRIGKAIDTVLATLPQAPLPATKATHWIAWDGCDGWTEDDQPVTDSQGAVLAYLAGSSDEAWDHRDDIASNGYARITLHGWRETTALLEPEQAFDGYEPGQEYFETTGETRTAVATIQVRVQMGAADEVPNAKITGPETDTIPTNQRDTGSGASPCWVAGKS